MHASYCQHDKTFLKIQQYFKQFTFFPCTHCSHLRKVPSMAFPSLPSPLSSSSCMLIPFFSVGLSWHWKSVPQSETDDSDGKCSKWKCAVKIIRAIVEPSLEGKKNSVLQLNPEKIGYFSDCKLNWWKWPLEIGIALDKGAKDVNLQAEKKSNRDTCRKVVKTKFVISAIIPLHF